MLRSKYSLQIITSVITTGRGSGAPAYRAKKTVDLLKCEIPDFIPPSLWPQVVQTSTQSITKCRVSFSSEFTVGKSKLWTSCDSVSLRNGNAWTSAWSTTQSNNGVDVFGLVWLRKEVISNSHCRTSYRKRYAVWPTACVQIMIL